MSKQHPEIAYRYPRVVLAGMMGCGKTTVGKILADFLGWELIDTDSVIEQRCGKSIREIFAREGEEYFRRQERELVAELQFRENCVMATGGGMIIAEENRNLLSRNSLLVHLHSPIDVLVQRLHTVADRPLLLQGEMQEELQTIYSQRAPVYEELPVQILSADRSPIQVVQEILFHLVSSHQVLSYGSARVHIGLNLTARLADALNTSDISSPIFVLADEHFWRSTGEMYLQKMVLPHVRNFDIHPILLPGSEQTKAIESVISIWQELIESGVERSSCLLVMGGGVLGDVGGFVASTILRGIRLIHLPSTLLAQIDSAIGGKTGVNLQETKNMVGTFYPAHSTFLDPLLLLTLPERELRSGIAEMIKAALLGDEDFFVFLESNLESVIRGELGSLTRAVARAAKIKVDIVAQDLLEKTGKRILLNFGHTFGHAIEALSEYRLRHGEAVAIGMVLATRLAIRLNLCSATVLDRLQALLQRAHLPLEPPELPPHDILEKIRRDKKRTHQKLQFVFPRKIGSAEVRPIDLDDQLLLAFHRKNP